MNTTTQVDTEIPLPPVSVDIAVGKLVDSIDIDQRALAEHMFNSGMSHEDIAGTTVNFSAMPFNTERPDTSGTFDASTKSIIVGVEAPILSKSQAETGGHDVDDLRNRVNSEAASSEASKILSHEMQHRIDDANGEQDNHRMSVIKRSAAKVLKLAGVATVTNIGIKMGVDNALLANGLTAAVTAAGAAKTRKSTKEDFDAGNVYSSDPAEQRAFRAEDTTPHFVTIQSKT